MSQCPKCGLQIGLHHSVLPGCTCGTAAPFTYPIQPQKREWVEITDEEQLIYDAWRDSEHYQVPMTEEGERLAQIRLRMFKRGWNYHKFYLKHGHISMQDYLDKQEYDDE
jgi:hypothetical protein